MFFDWLGRRGRAEREQKTRLWSRQARAMPLFQGLADAECDELARLAVLLADEKAVSTSGPLEWRDEMAPLLFLQMALPVLALGERGLAGWREVLLYPDAFKVRDAWHDALGLVHESEQELIGQARLDGPLVLSWPDVEDSPALDGWNVVIHEIAHKLDMLNGDANGYPPLHKGMSRETWTTEWSSAYQRFCRQVDAGYQGWLDPYASESPAEFFAVLSEAFFEEPHVLRRHYGALYRQLVLFYRQDPAARQPQPASRR